MKKRILTLLVLMPMCSIASEIKNTTVTRLMMDRAYGQKLFIQVEGTADPATRGCHTNQVWDYALATDDEVGKQLHAQLLAAYTAKKKVNLTGMGKDICIVNGNIEGLSRLEMF